MAGVARVPHQCSSGTVPPSRGIVGFVFSTAQPIAVSDVRKDPRFDKGTAELEELLIDAEADDEWHAIVDRARAAA